MPGNETANALGPQPGDYVASAARAALGAVPFVGSLLVEIAGTVIPNQRIDRLTGFAVELERRLGKVEREKVRERLTDEEFTDLIEEGLRQAARSTSDDRRRQIANVIANSVTLEEVSAIESKHLLRLLGEINDIEVIWLRFYLDLATSGDDAFRTKHDEVLTPVAAHMASPQSDIDKATLQESYKEHLCRLGLLRERYETDHRTKMPKFTSTGGPKVSGYNLTRLGDLLLRHIGHESS